MKLSEIFNNIDPTKGFYITTATTKKLKLTEKYGGNLAIISRNIKVGRRGYETIDDADRQVLISSEPLIKIPKGFYWLANEMTTANTASHKITMRREYPLSSSFQRKATTLYLSDGYRIEIKNQEDFLFLWSKIANSKTGTFCPSVQRTAKEIVKEL